MAYIIYSSPHCAWCDRAKELLASKNIEFEVRDITTNPEDREFIVGQGLKTVPQVYAQGRRIGGYEDLVEFLKLKEELTTVTDFGRLLNNA